MFRIVLVLVVPMMAWYVVKGLRRPEARKATINEALLVAAFLMANLDEVVSLSPATRRVTLIASLGIALAAFVKFVWDAKPWR